MKDYVENEKPYWLSLHHPRDGEMRWKLFNYLPSAHYEKAIDQAFQELAERELETDGGTTHLHQDGRRTTVYYWLDPDTGAALYHTEVNGNEANPFFGSVGDAEQYLEQQVSDDPDQHRELSLYEAKVKKVEDAVDVLTDQSGIDEFW